MKYLKFKIEAKGKSKVGPCIVEAPTPGSAIEFFLAIHGMLWYDIIEYKETNEELDPIRDENREEFDKIMKLNEKQIKELDEYHSSRCFKID